MKIIGCHAFLAAAEPTKLRCVKETPVIRRDGRDVLRRENVEVFFFQNCMKKTICCLFNNFGKIAASNPVTLSEDACNGPFDFSVSLNYRLGYVITFFHHRGEDGASRVSTQQGLIIFPAQHISYKHRPVLSDFLSQTQSRPLK